MDKFVDNLIDETQFLTFNKNEVFIRGKKLDKDQINELKDSAKAFYNSPIWKILVQEIRNESVKALYNAKTDKDLIAGQTMIFNLEIIENLLKKLLT
ncbi:MAG: hypothetical protein WC974_09005 [Thermoplasmata archaeon]